ncbi:MAG: hypothetical protein LBV72_02705 [Tannerella sp.]|jgi:hypothetical protein|nr:hypothetical protein [Tannerella sp.]
MKSGMRTVNTFIFSIISIFVFITCSNDDDEKDTSLLVGNWDCRIISVYENDEWVIEHETTYSGELYLVFDGKYFGWGGIAMNTSGDNRQPYFYDAENQVISFSSGGTNKVLKLTETDLEIETICKSGEQCTIRRLTLERMIE